MIAVMAVIVVGPVFFYGPAKAKLAPVLHNKLLFADADMAKADWHTNVASIVGVLGVGIWWLDGVAATFTSWASSGTASATRKRPSSTSWTSAPAPTTTRIPIRSLMRSSPTSALSAGSATPP